jgi:hypothetical protein
MNYISFIFKTEKEATVTSEENVDILANIWVGFVQAQYR